MRLTLLSFLVASLAIVGLGAAVSQMDEPLSNSRRSDCRWGGVSCTDSRQCCSGHCYLLDDDPQTCAVSHEVEIHTMFSLYLQ